MMMWKCFVFFLMSSLELGLTLKLTSRGDIRARKLPVRPSVKATILNENSTPTKWRRMAGPRQMHEGEQNDRESDNNGGNNGQQQVDNQDSNSGNKDNGGGDGYHQNDNDATGQDYTYANDGRSGENSSTANNSTAETTNSSLTDESFYATSPKKGLLISLSLGMAVLLIVSALVWMIMLSAHKRNASKSSNKKNRGGNNNDHISELFDKISDTYIEIERIATSSYTDVKNRLHGFSVHITSSSTNNRYNKQPQTSTEGSSDECSVVSSLSGGTIEHGNEQVLQSPFELATGEPSNDKTDLDSISVCVRNAKEGKQLLLGLERKLDKDEHNGSQPLFIHYVPI